MVMKRPEPAQQVELPLAEPRDIHEAAGGAQHREQTQQQHLVEWISHLAELTRVRQRLEMIWKSVASLVTPKSPATPPIVSSAMRIRGSQQNSAPHPVVTEDAGSSSPSWSPSVARRPGRPPASSMGRANPRILKRADAISSMPKCAGFATLIDRALIYRDDRYLAGGMRVGAYPQGVFISRNLTSDPNTGLGRWSDAEVASAIRDGRSKDGRELNLWGMPWAFFHNLAPDDAQAIARYLKTLPAAHNPNQSGRSRF